MKYTFYPGCSMEGTAKAYLQSIEAVGHELGMEIKELEDWNCCGATVASCVIGEYPAQVMAARNLALAEKMGQDVLVACSSCYMNLAGINKKFKEDEHFRTMANEALASAGLSYSGSLRVRFILDAMVNDVGLDKIAARVKKPLKGLKVAGYVGCQTVRAMPWEYDDPEQPETLDRLLAVLGAEPVPFPLKARCCGSSHTLPAEDIVLALSKEILASAKAGGADLIVTPCPMCQMNLDIYQSKINQAFNTSFNLPVLFFTQLMAIAFDLPAAARALEYCVVPPQPALAKVGT